MERNWDNVQTILDDGFDAGYEWAQLCDKLADKEERPTQSRPQPPESLPPILQDAWQWAFMRGLLNYNLNYY